jgi:dTDP-4-amino-4,6-dideoxygalactose transaminase
VNEVQGYNSRLDPLQAAILRVKLAHLDDWNKRRGAIAALYQAGLEGCGLTLPFVPEWAAPAWHLYVVQHPQRAVLQKALSEAGVGTLIHYPIPPHLQDAYADFGVGKGMFPIAERIHNHVFSLPMGPHLGVDDAEQVVTACIALAGVSV